MFQLLIDNQLLSVPIFEERYGRKELAGFVDMLDIVSYLVEELNLMDETKWPGLSSWTAHERFTYPCTELIGRSIRKDYAAICKDASIFEAIESMSSRFVLASSFWCEVVCNEWET